MISTSSSIQYLKGVGAKRAALFAGLGIFTVDDLLGFYPRAYEDWSSPVHISEATVNEINCVKAVCIKPVNEYISSKTKIKIFTTTVSDGADSMEIVFFNNPYAAAKIQIGKEYLFYGKVEGNFISKKMVSPNFSDSGEHIALKPIYKQTYSLTSNIISKTVKTALAEIKNIQEPLPAGMLRAYGLINKDEAVRTMHFPKSQKQLQLAKDRLAFEKLLYLRLGMLSRKRRCDSGQSKTIQTDCSAEFETLLPFSLTGAQKRVISEAVNDLKSLRPMSRLIQGDVGSGKTAVALSLMYTAVKNNMQCAMMAPTEILAEQHFESITRTLKNTDIKVSLLIGSMRTAEKTKIKKSLKDGSTDIVIGTHALIQKDVGFKNLGLIIADEQHRFGVKQRSSLLDKSEQANLLVMSATPIPRTLSMIMYGDLDISVLDEMPPGRQAIKTYCVPTSYHNRIYDFIKKYADAGRQTYIVCPLVEESEETSLTAAVRYAKELKDKVFSDYSLGILHGKMKNSEKDEIMRRFKNNEIQILVSTTVIEVGIDVPNAVIMVIENAERFGLSQLHQLRGRIGRGKEESYCILVSDSDGEISQARFKVICDTCDGFKIAEADYAIRGPGEFFGESQHGFKNSGIAELLGNSKLIKQVTDASEIIIDADPKLSSKKYSSLKAEVEKLFSKFNFSTMN